MSWERKKLSECCLSISDGDHQPPPKTDTGIPFITISNITSTSDIDFSNTMFVSKEYYDNIDNKRKAQKNDILYSVVGSFGIPVYIKETIPFVFQRHIAILRVDETIILPRYLYYVMKSRDFYMQADSVALGAAQRTISLTSLRNMKIELPPIEIQNKIVNILSAYDDLIENNQKQIKLLEEAAQRLYKEWFVDLRFPGHEKVKIIDGVPEGWKKNTLPDIAPIITGKKDANYSTDNGTFPFFTCAQEPLLSPTYSFDCNAVILAGNGDFNVKLYRGKFEAYQRTYIFSPYDDSNLYLLYYGVKNNMRQLFQGASGSTIKFLTKKMFENIIVLQPDYNTFSMFNSLCESIQKKAEVLHNQIINAKEARDRLLPKLMNGEIEV